MQANVSAVKYSWTVPMKNENRAHVLNPKHPRTPRICQIRVRVSIFHFTFTARLLADRVFLSVPECSGVFLCSDA